MFTVMFALGRLPGWIAHWKEMTESGPKIGRPRQIYTGPTLTDYVPIDERKPRLPRRGQTEPDALEAGR